MPKFKVGQRVKYIHPQGRHMFHNICGTVKMPTVGGQDYPYVAFDNGENWACMPERLHSTKPLPNVRRSNGNSET